jgi:glycosyltransferase involved in cell wall biosynthesis
MERTSKNKILFFLPLPPPIHGAALRNKSLVESKLISEAFSIQVLPFDFAKAPMDIGKVSVEKICKAIIRLFQIICKIITFKPDLVYFNVSLYGFALYRDFIYAMIFKFFNCKLLFHLRTQGIRDQARKSKIKKTLFRTLFKNTNVICLSEFLTTDIQGIYDGRPIIINNGIEDVSVNFCEPEPPNAIPVILFLSNLSKAKGILELVEALGILREKGVEFEARIVGDSVDVSIAELQKAVNANKVTNAVKILGPKFASEKYKLLKSADIFILPTYFEAFPGTILEAMQFGLPVISTFEGAIPEIVDDGKTGFLIKKHDTLELAEKIDRLVQSRELREMYGKAGRKKFLQSYTLEIFERKMKNAFEQVISSRISYN